MTLIHQRLQRYLDHERLPYHIIHHEADVTARQTAVHTHVSPHVFAKVVVVRLDGDFALAVLPADHRLDLVLLRQMTGAAHVRLASEGEIQELFPDCEVGAEPPFGNLYNLSVYMSEALLDDDMMTFNAGTHTEAVCVSVQDYIESVRPTILAMSYLPYRG
jgi:Ala-tRNA(Pro) deacylase